MRERKVAMRDLILRTCESVLEVSSAWDTPCGVCKCDGLTARTYNQNERSEFTTSFIIISYLRVSSLSSYTLTQFTNSRAEVTMFGAPIRPHNQDFLLICDFFPHPVWLLLHFALKSFG